jgi:hypothetical protein
LPLCPSKSKLRARLYRFASRIQSLETDLRRQARREAEKADTAILLALSPSLIAFIYYFAVFTVNSFQTNA